MLSILFVKNEQDYDLHTHENNEGLAHVIDPLKYLHYLWLTLNGEFVLIIILLLFQVLKI